MMPPVAQFIKEMQALNVRKNDTIVVYDKSGMLSSPRAFWMLKTFGASNVFILNGTFSKWLNEKKSTESGDNERAWSRRR
jgi:thiosulfate/3-mercaptopyruvate sulfurtransferase